MALSFGVQAIGLNFIPRSKRCIDVDRASDIVEQVRGRAVCVGVVADLSKDAILELVRTCRLDRMQLHGAEPAELVSDLGELAYKAYGIQSPDDVIAASRQPGDPLLVDSRVGAQAGGTGRPFDWSWLGDLPKERDIVLAGGLNPGNVGEAIRQVRPFGVDVSSGVELPGRPGSKDAGLIESFIREARQAAAEI